MSGTPPLPVSVRTLCDVTARAGDLDHRFTPSPSAREGLEGQREIARRRGADYLTEVVLTGEVAGIMVRGRADGYDPMVNRLEEIKTHRGAIARLASNQRALHRAQLRSYGALLCAERHLESIELTLVYLEVGSRHETLISEHATAAELWQELSERCRRYRGWAEREAEHRRERDITLCELTFPFADFRPGQRYLAEESYKAAATGRVLMAQAPTGIGKTLGTLFPLLKAMPRHGLDRLAYLTMRTPGRRLALEALAQLGARLKQNGLALRVLELTAREKACEYPGRACHGEACPLAAGFYDRLPAAREAAAERRWLDRESLRELAAEHGVCPYYLGQEMARWSDVIVGDVNHWFDDHALLHGLMREQGWRVGVLVDEAHNLIGRARGMYSVALAQRDLGRLRRTAPERLKAPLGRLQRQWQALIRAASLDETGEPGRPAVRHLEALPPALLGSLQALASTLAEALGEHPELGAEWQELLFEVLAFMRLAERLGDHTLCELTREGRGRARLALHNLIPADFLASRFIAAHVVVLFSATLGPADYQRHLLGLPAGSVWREVPSPFAANQLEVSIRADISTRLSDREASLAPIVAEIAAQHARRPGCYLAFFSSFAYLEAVFAHFIARHPEIPAWAQERRMNEAARDAFLSRFTGNGCGIGFAVLGGAFGEGIDLPGERLVGAFVATLGLPPTDSINEVLKTRLQARYGRGVEYAYRVPGMVKVVQAAGRVIRGPEDSGTVVLMDDRFVRGAVQQHLPGWWGEPRVRAAGSPGSAPE
ncbi:ATP-dependent DNA helicase [Halomonas halodenitrificans]|uniref:ATP-dependent DNA helicase n=1 Tax=Halomonas halodenitrificans TaxID=28252 RepID=UPI00068696FB|nr:ATP-dependent DNA helicase [Halomonas halodenitrificans]